MHRKYRTKANTKWSMSPGAERYCSAHGGFGVDDQGCDWVEVSSGARGVACGGAYRARDRRPADVRRPSCTGWTPCGCRSSSPACRPARSEEHTSELQSLMRISYAVSCLKKKKTLKTDLPTTNDLLEYPNNSRQ